MARQEGKQKTNEKKTPPVDCASPDYKCTQSWSPKIASKNN